MNIETGVSVVSAKQQADLSELMIMIKALERLKESRPSLTFVKTGVSSSPLPGFLVDQDIVSEQKRAYTPSPLVIGVANEDRPVLAEARIVGQRPAKRKKILRKSVRLKRLTPVKSREKQEIQAKRPNLYSEKRSVAKLSRRRHHKGVWHWLEELAIIMSKMSLFGLFLILLLLGGVFFGVGFLAAVTNIQEKSSAPTWQQASQCPAQPTAGHGMASPLLKMAEGAASTLIDQKVASLESKLGGGVLNRAVQKVPPSLQPFALQMQNKFSQQSQAVIGGGGRAIKSVFKPAHFGSTPPPALPPQPASTMPAATPPAFGQMAHPAAQQAPVQPESLRQYTPAQQAFMWAGHLVQQQAAPQPVMQQPSGYGAQGYSVQAPPQGYNVYPGSQPVGPTSGYAPPPVSQGYGHTASLPMQSQPYGVSQPYGYAVPPPEQPKMIGMG